jgi:hypothetical protein
MLLPADIAILIDKPTPNGGLRSLWSMVRHRIRSCAGRSFHNLRRDEQHNPDQAALLGPSRAFAFLPDGLSF